jgi:hypothetical protein
VEGVVRREAAVAEEDVKYIRAKWAKGVGEN